MHFSLKTYFVILAGIIAVLWATNSASLVGNRDSHDTRIIAHRGVHQRYVGTDRSRESCHAAPVAPITHDFIENTIPSMAEAFRLGADVVELDVHLTPDNVFAVFHDWTVDCRTDGTGVTRKLTLDTLQTLDLGYRIDDGSGTYPLRGKGVGLLPTLDQVMDENLGGQYLINFKSRDAKEGVALAALMQNAEISQQIFGVYGGQTPTRTAIKTHGGLRGFDRRSIKQCLLTYLAVGWTGYVPKSCRNTMVTVPISHSNLLWGWPHRFTKRMNRVGTDVILAGAYGGNSRLSSINTPEDFAEIPDRFDGYIWTDQIEVIGPLLASR